MLLDPSKDYGFTQLGVSTTADLPFWDKFRLEKVQEIFKTCEFIIDFGNSSRELSKLLANDLKGKKKVSVDINECYSPDIVADICDLDTFEDESVDGIICAAILEHVYNPFLAVSELHRILKKCGKSFIYVPWLYNYHAPATGEFNDYYRFSKDGIKYLFKDFNKVELCPVRGRIETILNLTSTFGKRSLFQKHFGKIVRKIDKYDENYASGFNVFIIK